MKTKTEKHYAILLYPKSDNPYLAQDRNGNPHVFGRLTAAKEFLHTEVFSPRPKIVTIQIKFEI